MAEGRMNLAALQQRDPYISDIVDTASQVALYSFNSKSNEWEKTSIEGSLFIYKRSASPVNGFMILNRLGLNNLIEPITKHLEFQQQDPFLLYRNAKSIYGVWFYEKEDCKRLGHKLNSYVQAILSEHKSQEPGATGDGGATGPGKTAPPTIKMASMLPASQVDIMQMLSKAQQEYDTGGKKSEPKPMIDNPNASATKTTTSSHLIRPRPLKIPDSDTTLPDESTISVTPGTGVISLDALFRTASLQQGTTTQKQPSSSQPAPHMDSYFSEHSIQRSLSVSGSGVQQGAVGVDSKPSVETDDLPPLLKHIMSTGSMLEDIERQQRAAHRDSEEKGAAGATGPTAGNLGAPVIPDLTQPPPNHPAYRGISPHAQQQQARQARKSPMEEHTISDSTRRDTAPDTVQPKSVPASVPANDPNKALQILAGNLLPVFLSSSTASSQATVNTPPSLPSAHKVSPEAHHGARLSPRADIDYTVGKSDLTPAIKTAPLLTPGDLLSSTASAALSTSTSTSFTQDKGSMSSCTLAAAASSLSTELLSPMAFITSSSTARRTPPVTASQERPSSVHSERTEHSHDSEALQLAALTKDQLLQALTYLLKHDSNFITTIHEAYLKSLHELSGQKS